MTEYDRHEPGTFCWVELSTGDFPAAREFYTNLFGWQAWDAPLPDGGVYTMFGIGERYVGAGTQQRDEERSQGIPPHWNAYVATEDADQAAKAAEAAGGTMLVPPFDVLESGRMTVMADPTGAAISAWQPKDHPGFGLADVPGSFGWAELWTPDTARAQAFYEEVFGWTARVVRGGLQRGQHPPAARHRTPSAAARPVLGFRLRPEGPGHRRRRPRGRGVPGREHSDHRPWGARQHHQPVRAHRRSLDPGGQHQVPSAAGGAARGASGAGRARTGGAGPDRCARGARPDRPGDPRRGRPQRECHRCS
jgi:predicted enzyme related to lactoylglutathione lyase